MRPGKQPARLSTHPHLRMQEQALERREQPACRLRILFSSAPKPTRQNEQPLVREVRRTLGGLSTIHVNKSVK